MIEKMVTRELFTPRSPWASNVVVVKKHDKTPTITLDYRALNNVKSKDSSPLPNIADFWTPVKVRHILESWARVHFKIFLITVRSGLTDAALQVSGPL